MRTVTLPFSSNNARLYSTTGFACEHFALDAPEASAFGRGPAKIQIGQLRVALLVVVLRLMAEQAVRLDHAGFRPPRLEVVAVEAIVAARRPDGSCRR